jgi:hypothetical protein
LDDYVQTSYAQEDISVSLVFSTMLTPEQLITGTMPAKPDEVVLDKTVIDDFLRDNLGKSICLDSMEEFIGRRITVPNLEDYRIVGICDTDSPSLFVDPDQAMYIITNAKDVGEDISLGFMEEDAGEEDLVGSGKGYFACGGKIVPILWSRNTETAPFVYTLEDGTPVELGIGKTYVGIIPKGSPVEYK